MKMTMNDGKWKMERRMFKCENYGISSPTHNITISIIIFLLHHFFLN